MSSCIICQNHSVTTTLLDIPRSIELAQDLSSSTSSKRLISSKPLEHPYPSVEPRSDKAKANLAAPSLDDLFLQKHLEFALGELKKGHEGPWCLSRVTVGNENGKLTKEEKRQRLDPEDAERAPTSTLETEDDHVLVPDGCMHFRNSEHTPLNVVFGSNEEEVTIPPRSTFLQGEIDETLVIFKDSAPKFNFIVIDPPWPNRSAKRKHSYSISYGNSEIKLLLSSIPLFDHLEDEGLVAVWVTNKPALREMLLGEGGLFEEWGIQLIEEWIWLKVTSSGEPICALDSMWRKPYEVLLVGMRGKEKRDGDVKRKVIIGVPDLHSRKPNLKKLLEDMMGTREDEYEALEIFARNLIAGWWSWGNEVLKFQSPEHWAEP